MPAVAEERVLVVPTSKFRNLGYFQGFTTDVERYLPALLEGDDLSYRPRGEMETDPDFKQLIPYVLFRHTEAGVDRLFQYQRGGGQGESRLHAKRSVGVGGHISSDDVSTGPTAASSIQDVYREGMRRELAEEVEIRTVFDERCVGLINDDQTEVGQVHLGVVHLCDVQQPDVQPREHDILDARFRPIAEILGDIEHFETWSEIAVKALFNS